MGDYWDALPGDTCPTIDAGKASAQEAIEHLKGASDELAKLDGEADEGDDRLADARWYLTQASDQFEDVLDRFEEVRDANSQLRSAAEERGEKCAEFDRDCDRLREERDAAREELADG